MAEIAGLSHDARNRAGMFGRFLNAFKQGWSRLSRSRKRTSYLRAEDWPDYLLRDVGLDRTARDETDPRTMRPRIGF